eukprot:COSAG06_NODE_57667_length_279_cov_1.416667_1_plen_55_part_10
MTISSSSSSGGGGDGGFVAVRGELEAVERRLDRKLDGVNERLDGLAKLLEPLLGG